MESFRCDNCHSVYSYKKNLIRHLQKCGSSSTSTKSKTIRCPKCQQIFSRNELLRDHAKSYHNVTLEEEVCYFRNLDEFRLWKKIMEREGVCSYGVRSAHTKGNVKRTYLQCYRSGYYKGSGKGIRKLKSIGTNKMGSSCTSSMVRNVVTEDYRSYGVKVIFCKTHFGHEENIRRCRISTDERMAIAEKLSAGVTLQKILEDAHSKESNTESSERLQFLKKRDLYNVIRDFRISYSTRRHKTDATSVKMWIEEMKQCEPSPILFYKECGTAIDYSYGDTVIQLQEDDFCLIIMTAFQVEQFKRFGMDKLFVDGTRGMTAYGFIFNILVVINEFGDGIPVAYMFSSRKTASIYSLFFLCVQQKAGIITPIDVFMSDDEPAVYEAWKSIMGPVQHKLLCPWHVLRNWAKSLRLIKSPTKKSHVYKTLKTLQKMCDEHEFIEGFQRTLIELSEDNDTEEFCQYLRNSYAYRTKEWAYCFHVQLGISTTMLNESVNKIIKYSDCYLQGKKCQRLDIAIDAVLKFTRDKMFERMIQISENVCDVNVAKISEAHNRSQTIDLSAIVSDDAMPNQWFVPSQRFLQRKYVVKKIEEPICQNTICELKCDTCCICMHEYECTCMNHIIHYNICKHVHAVVQKFNLMHLSDGLDTDDNQIENVPCSVLPDLHLYSPKLNEICHEEIVSVVPDLRKIDLDDNQIEIVPCSVLPDLHLDSPVVDEICHEEIVVSVLSDPHLHTHTADETRREDIIAKLDYLRSLCIHTKITPEKYSLVIKYLDEAIEAAQPAEFIEKLKILEKKEVRLQMKNYSSHSMKAYSSHKSASMQYSLEEEIFFPQSFKENNSYVLNVKSDMSDHLYCI